MKSRLLRFLAVAAAAAACGASLAQYVIRIPVDDAGVVAAGVPVATPISLSAPAFGSVGVGEYSEVSATLTNPKNYAISVTAPGAGSVTGTGFAFVSTTCGGSLAAGQSCIVKVQMNAATAGSYTGTLTVSTSKGVLTAALSGSRAAAVASLTSSPGQVSYGAVLNGQTADRTMTVTNTGNVTLSSLNFGGMARVGGTCASSLAPGQGCTVVQRYTASGAGQFTSAIFSAQGTPPSGPAVDAPWIQMYAVSQSTFSSGLSFDTTDADIGTVARNATGYKSVTITNTSGGMKYFNYFTAQAPFSVDAGGTTCPAGWLAAGASCVVRISITSASAGDFGNKVYLNENGSSWYFVVRAKVQ